MRVNKPSPEQYAYAGLDIPETWDMMAQDILTGWSTGLPHAVIEYTRSLENQCLQAGIMQAVHNSLLASGHFGEVDIKVRACGYDHALVAGKPDDFIHVTIYLLSGRTPDIKKQLTVGVLETLQGLDLRAASITVDARDMDRAIYSKTRYGT